MIQNIIKIIILSVIGFIEISYFINPQERVISANESLRKIRTQNFVPDSKMDEIISRRFAISKMEFIITFLLFLVGGAPQAIMILCQSFIIACIELSMMEVNEKIIRLDCLITTLICLTGFTV